MSESTFKNGDRVRFKPGPKSKDHVEAMVTGFESGARGGFLVTEDAAGKVRAGACSAA